MTEINNQVVVHDFLEATRKVIAQNTSDNYSELVLKRIKKDFAPKFRFLQEVHLKGPDVSVEENVNQVDGREVAELFKEVLDFIGPAYLKVLITKQLESEEIEYLEELGVDFG